MVAATYEQAMVRVFADEGGFTNDPVDPGQATNWGITIFDARKYWKPDATVEDVRNMPKSVAREIYDKHYAQPINYNNLPAGFDYSVLDAEINSGFGRAIPWAGKALNITRKITVADMVTLSNGANDKKGLIQRYWQLRLSFLHGLRTWSHFGVGWGRRCAQGEAAAVKMWLTIGAVMSPADTKVVLNGEADKAKKQVQKHAAGAGSSTAGGAAASLPTSSKVLIAIFITIAVVLVIYFVRQMLIHNERAKAYASA